MHVIMKNMSRGRSCFVSLKVEGKSDCIDNRGVISTVFFCCNVVICFISCIISVMKMTTLCYIEKEEQYLMMHRVSKKNDPNEGKWIGVGGHFEEGESPEECMLREVQEETGLQLSDYEFRGIITFVSDEWETEYMFLYTADASSLELTEEMMAECDEGILQWIAKDQILNLNLWEGDREFLKELLEDKHEVFSMKLEYRGEDLKKVTRKRMIQ